MSDSDDGDFQIPFRVISKCQPLKQSNGAPARKRLKLPCRVGKENREGTSQCLGSDESGRTRRPKLSALRASKSGERPGICGTGATVSSKSNFDRKDAAEEERFDVSSSNELKVVESLESNVSDFVRDGQAHVDDLKVHEFEGCGEKGGLEIVKSSYYSSSVEARLLGLISKPVSMKCKDGCLEEDGFEDFEAGSQLNELMNLCCETSGIHDSKNLEVGASESRGGGLRVDCPLCGFDISDLSEEVRHAHTNDCLDRRFKDSTPNEVQLAECRVSFGCRADDEFLEEEACRDVKLEKYIYPCSKMSDEGSSGLGTNDKGIKLEISGKQINILVECPMCGTDISNLSEELRHIHTNGCLEERENCKTNPVKSQGDSSGELESGMARDVSINAFSVVEEENGLPSVDISKGSGGIVYTSGIQRGCLVECPLCGTDITGLGEELRLTHTNACLDKGDNSQKKAGKCFLWYFGFSPWSTELVANYNGKIKSNSLGQVVDANPVLEWLRSLGLSKYEEAFSREEIDWDTLQWLTEEDLLNIGISALGPRKKIVHALKELRSRNNHTGERENEASHSSSGNANMKLSSTDNKLITEYFQGPKVDRKMVCSHNKQLPVMEKNSHDAARKKVGARKSSSIRKVKDIPPWCCIPGTPFRVDAFSYLRGDCCHWFLTHFHIDHYQGLTRSFCHGKIYCSSITAHLVNAKLGVPWDKLQVLPIKQKVTVAGVTLTCFDANHCPGSIIILFEPSNGKAVLHTGDFRFSEEMASNSILQSCHINTLILDTTYCNPQYDFPKQEAVIQFVIEAIQAEAFNPKTLFLIGSYTIGKEKLFLEVARLLRKKIYVGAAKLRLLKCLQLPDEDIQWFTVNEMESHIHVVPMWTIASFKRLKHFSNQYHGRFNLIVAFSPTGWTFGKGKKKNPGRRWQQGTIIRYEVPYSEHCSFSELREFVRFISPEHVIPSVNNDGPDTANAMITRLISDP
ncbi:putative metallo-beta-lactamase, sterile alpha motif domain, DNA repair metallo-beta-lactamase [Dioscorea sansibarensis]